MLRQKLLNSRQVRPVVSLVLRFNIIFLPGRLVNVTTFILTGWVLDFFLFLFLLRVVLFDLHLLVWLLVLLQITYHLHVVFFYVIKCNVMVDGLTLIIGFFLQELS